MKYLTDYTLKKQTPENQFKVLQSFEKDDEISVELEEKGGISGPVTSVVVNGSSEAPEEVHIQFLNYESNYRDDDMPHHTISITRTEDGHWSRADFSYSCTDMGRTRKNIIDNVKRIWPSLTKLRQMTVLSHEEAQIVSLKEAGLNKQEMAEQWGCDETTIDAILASVRKKYDQAEQTMDKLESVPIDLESKQRPLIGLNPAEYDWKTDRLDDLDQQADSKSESE